MDGRSFNWFDFVVVLVVTGAMSLAGVSDYCSYMAVLAVLALFKFGDDMAALEKESEGENDDETPNVASDDAGEV